MVELAAAHGVAEDPRACLSRRSRYAAAQRGGFARVHGRGLRKLSGRAHRVDRRPLLRDGPRPALGAGGGSRTNCWSTATRRTSPHRLRRRSTPPTRAAKTTSSSRPPPSSTPAGTRATMRDGDVVVFMNFRADRARQMTRALTSPAFAGFRAAARSQARDVRVPHVVRRRVRGPAGGLRAADDPQQLRRIPGASRPHAAADRRDREVRARHLLLQRRRGSGLPGRGPHPRAVARESPPTT